MSNVKPPLSRVILVNRVIPAKLASRVNIGILVSRASPVKLENHVKNANLGISNQETRLLQLLPE